MESIISWTVSLTVMCATGAIILFLSPASSVSKTVKTVVIMCLLAVFITPVMKISLTQFSINGSFDNITDGSNGEITQKMLQYACLEAEELCEDFVVQCSVSATKIEAEAYIDQNNSIYISNIRIYLSRDYYGMKDKINEKIKNVFNIDGEFIWQ